MKKSCAVKCIAIVLAMVMVLGTSLSAMAAAVSSTTKYVSGGYRVTTDVSGLNGNEMVTYLVHDADSLYKVTPANIDYVDQKTAAAGGSVQFGYTGTGEWNEAKKIYVGAESLSEPVQSTNSILAEGATLIENGKVSSAVNEDLTNEEGTLKYININNVATTVTSVYKNNDPIDFMRADGARIAIDCEITSDDTIYVTYKMPEVLSAASYIDNGLATLNYTARNAVGNIGSLNGVVSKIDGDAAGTIGESDAYWFLPQKWESQDVSFKYQIRTAEEVAANSKYAPYLKETILADGSIPQSVRDAIEADSAEGKLSGTVTATLTDYQPYGIILNGSAQTLDFNVYVPADGVYNLITRTNSYTVERKPVIEIYNAETEELVDTITATPSAANAWSLGKGDKTLDLAAGNYIMKVKSSTGIVRFDFAALIPEGPAANAAMTDKETFLDYVENSEDTYDTIIRLGDVYLSDTALTAFARVIGYYETCGIKVDGVNYQAAGTAGDGAFAVELADDNGGLKTEFANAQVSAYADSYETPAGVITVVE